MAVRDTSAESERILLRLYRKMTTAQKARRVFSAYRMGKMLTIAGIRVKYPDASDEEIWHLWARRHLGDDLYRKVYQEGNSG